MDIGNNIGIAYRDVIIAPPVIVGDFCLTRLAEVDIKIELVEVGTYKVSVTPNGTEVYKLGEERDNSDID